MCAEFLENTNKIRVAGQSLISLTMINLTLSLCSSRWTWCANIWSRFIKRGIFSPQRKQASRDENGHPRPSPSQLIKSCPLGSYNPISDGQQRLSQLCSPACLTEGRRMTTSCLRHEGALSCGYCRVFTCLTFSYMVILLLLGAK